MPDDIRSLRPPPAGLIAEEQIWRERLDEAIEQVAEIEREIHDAQTVAFQNFDQKANQLLNMLSSINKTLSELRGSLASALK